MNRKNIKNIPLSKSDAEFIADLIYKNENYIKNIVYNTLRYENRYLADDTISELHLLMCRKIEVLKVHTCPKAWIMVAAKRTAQGMIAKHQKDSLSVPIDTELLLSEESDVFETAVYDIWLENKVPEKLISRLSKREREIYHKIYIEGKTTKEIASELNISMNSVQNIHKNLRDKIKDAVKRKDF